MNLFMSSSLIEVWTIRIKRGSLSERQISVFVYLGIFVKAVSIPNFSLFFTYTTFTRPVKSATSEFSRIVRLMCGLLSRRFPSGRQDVFLWMIFSLIYLYGRVLQDVLYTLTQHPIHGQTDFQPEGRKQIF